MQVWVFDLSSQVSSCAEGQILGLHCEFLHPFSVLCYNFLYFLSSGYLCFPSAENWEQLDLQCLEKSIC